VAILHPRYKSLLLNQHQTWLTDFRLIEQGLMSHQTRYRSYWGRVFAGQMT